MIPRLSQPFLRPQPSTSADYCGTQKKPGFDLVFFSRSWRDSGSGNQQSVLSIRIHAVTTRRRSTYSAVATIAASGQAVVELQATASIS
jgi:hypothetical protein